MGYQMTNETEGPSGLTREELEAHCAALGRTIIECLPKGVGCTFMMYDFGEDGNMAYISNGKRKDMIAMLKEFIVKLEGH